MANIGEKLQAPFHPDDIEWRAQSCGVTNNRPWVRVIAYIDSRAIQKRLDELFGWDGWTEEYRHDNGNVICRLGVKSENGWIYKENGASNTDIEAFKGGISGAFKRVASSGYGIGRYLYNLEEGFAPVAQLQRPDSMKGWHEAKTKDKQHTIFWQPPQLPKWALPSNLQDNTPQTSPEAPQTQKRTAKEPITPAQQSHVVGLAKDYSMSNDDMRSLLKFKFKVNRSSELTTKQAGLLISKFGEIIEEWRSSQEVAATKIEEDKTNES
jgi:hypothetical protein